MTTQSFSELQMNSVNRRKSVNLWIATETARLFAAFALKRTPKAGAASETPTANGSRAAVLIS